MVSIGSAIKTLRRAKKITQDELAVALCVTHQSVSKWENDLVQPDISLIPLIAEYFGVTIDELFDYKLNTLTNKERFIKFMVDNEILEFKEDGEYYINTENFNANNQLAKVGEVFADIIKDEHIETDVLFGTAYHGISFAAATAVTLYNKYSVVTNLVYERKQADSRGRDICGYSVTNGNKIVVIDDIVNTGGSLIKLINKLKEKADVEIVAVISIAHENANTEEMKKLTEEYGIKFYSIISDEDIRCYNNHKILEKN